MNNKQQHKHIHIGPITFILGPLHVINKGEQRLCVTVTPSLYRISSDFIQHYHFHVSMLYGMFSVTNSAAELHYIIGWPSQWKNMFDDVKFHSYYKKPISLQNKL